MNALVRQIILVLFMLLTLAGVSFGKQVYLKDGGIIDSQSVWRQGDKVFVKVNRDIIAEFNSSEIDLRRTFPKSAASKRQSPRKVTADPATEAAKSAAPASAVAKPESQPAVQPKPGAASPPAAPALPMVKTPLQPAAATSVPADSASQPDKAGLDRGKLEAVKLMGDPAQMTSGFPMTVLLLALALFLLIIVGQWVIFQKAGQAGWKSLIPFYNMYILMVISGKPGWWMFLLFVPLVNVIILLFAFLSLAKKFGRSELFGIGLFLLPMIFIPLLAFSGSEYEG